MKSSSKKHLRRTLLCALFAGSIAAPFAVPHAYALPIEGANAATNAGEADISTSGTVMDITGKTAHNILRWEDFSIEQNEKVRFDGGNQERDYLNLVTGEGASNIYGTIEGGRNIYLVNPHGILFAEGAQVNTGGFYLSTANPADVLNKERVYREGRDMPLWINPQHGNVLNLGTVKANKLFIEGVNVTVLSTDAVTEANGTPLGGGEDVKIRSLNPPRIGYDVGNKTTRNFDVNGTAMPHDVSDYAHPNTAVSATSRGWYVATLSGYAHTDYDYMRVHDVYELQHIAAQMKGRYMLAGNIDAGVTNTWNRTSNGIEGFHPIGGGSSDAKFKGIFDGVGHTIEGLYIRHIDQNRIGLFGNVNGSYIENVSLKDSHVTGKDQVGGIVGYALGGNIRNVSFSGTVDGSRQVGGILGAGRYFTIRSTYHAGTVSGDSDVGGFVGFSNHVPLWDVWNVGNVRATGRNIGGIAGHVQDSTIQNALHTGTVIRQGSGIEASVGGIVGNAESEKINHVVWKSGSVTQEGGAFTADAVGVSSFVRTTDVQECTDAQLKQTATYTDWKDEDDNAVVATEGGKGTPWRIYDGKTTPLLTGLMKGTKRLEKIYDGKTFGAGDAHIHMDSTAEKNIGEYDAQGIYSDPFGYDLIGSTYKVIPRVLSVGTVAAQSKTYDGNTSADASKFHAALVGVVSGDENLVSVTATGAAYNSKDVAAANTVNYTGVALGGTGAGNYRIASTVQGAGNITAKQLNLALTGDARFDKTYDGTANVTQSLTKDRNYTLTNFVNGEGAGIELDTVTGKYADKNAGTGKTVTFGGLTLTGTGAGNYTLDKTALAGTGTISQKSLTLALTGGARFDKTYDGTANVTQTLTKDGNYTLTNFVNGEGADIALAPVTGTYTDKNAGTGKAVTFGGLTLTGTGAGNYVLNTSTLAGTGTIAHRDLTLTADAKSIVQDGPLPAFTGQASGFAEGEDASVFGADGITFGTTVTNTDRPIRYDIIGRVGGVSDGVVGNYRIGQAAGNTRAFTVYAAVPGGILAALVQDAAPRFDMGFGQEVYVFGLPRPIPTARLGIYRFSAGRDFNIEGLRLD